VFIHEAHNIFSIRAEDPWGGEATEASAGGPIAAVQSGDIVTIDVTRRRVDVKLSKSEFAERLKKVKKFKPRYTSGVMHKYALLVGSASKGAITG